MLMKCQALKQAMQFCLAIGRLWWALILLTSSLAFAGVYAAETSNLTVRLIDTGTNSVLVNRKVVALERDTNGKLNWSMAQTTDNKGVASFALAGLGNGKTYVLRTSPYYEAWVSSNEVRSPGKVDFQVGRLDVLAINGATGARLANTKIVAYERLSDGSRNWVTQFITNANGFARIAFPGLGQGRSFHLGAVGAIDNRQKFSADLTESGSFKFVVGNRPLNITLVNGVNGQSLPGVEIFVKQHLAGETSKTVTKKNTDELGKAVFDLEDLGSDSDYFLTAKPYGAWVISKTIKQPGDFVFKVGTFEVTAINGATGARFINTDITVYERLADGSRKWHARQMTDGQGIVRLDLPGLGLGRQYFLAGVSPSDGSTKYSNDFSRTGKHQFIVGNKPLNVKLVNGISGKALPTTDIIIVEELADSRVRWMGKKTTDTQGRVTLDLEGLGTGRKFVLRARPYGSLAESRVINQPGDFTFKVGTFEVMADNGATGTALTNVDVTAYERLADGSRKWRDRQKTDAQGVVRFDLPGLGTGRIYQLSAASPSDGSLQYSPELTAAGKYRFVVGSKPLNVKLVNGINGLPLAGVDVVVREQLADGNSQGTVKKTTDAQGKITFDLKGLGAGRQFFLKTKPYGSWVNSRIISQPGEFTFNLGTFEVTAVNGSNGAVLPNTDLTVFEHLADGSRKWRNRQKTDTQGIVRFDLPGLGAGRIYQLAAISPVDSSVKYSPHLTVAGKYRFVVGNKPLNVKLVNGINAQPLADKEIIVKQRLADGSLKWIARKITDDQGASIFDLEGLGSGNEYVLQTKPYNSGSVYSNPITQPGDFVFQVGKLAVTLRDSDTGNLLPGHNITLLEKTQSGSLTWRKQGVTDSAGTVHFDPEGIDQAKVFTVKAINVFGRGKNYFMPWVSGPGAVDFSISKNGDYSLDMEPPSVAIDSPKQNALVSHAGFNLKGRTSDSQAISKLVFRVISPARGVTYATVGDANESWEFAVKKSMIAPGERVRIELSAFDRMGNKTTVNHYLRIVEDTTAPVVTVTSPENGASVSASTFVVTGTATDDTRVEQLVANVRDPVLGRIINDRPLKLFGDQGSWALPIDQAKTGRKLTITITAKDLAGNLSSEQIAVNTSISVLDPHQLMNRITFGATPSLLDEIDAIGGEAFLRQQLNPSNIDDSIFEGIKAELGLPEKVSDFQYQQLMYGIHTKRQLLEVMTAFWENHFNTDVQKSGLAAELAENRAFRQHALGYFRDLLLASANSPAMLRYLDGVTNHHEEPNENYARELLELHTLGVNGGYSHSDVAEAARVFTGWRLKDNAFQFSSWAHDYGGKTVLGRKFLPGAGVEEGMQLLDMLASHPNTARFICTKLLGLLVTDTPSKTSVENCAGGFLASDGHIGYIVELILYSPEFSDAQNFHNKIKTPLEFVIGMMRNFQATPAKWDSDRALRGMGTQLFRYPDPTGYSEDGLSWLNSHQLLQRMFFVNKVAANPVRDYATHIATPVRLFLQQGLTGAEDIVNYIFELALAGDYSQPGREQALAILTDDGTADFNIDAPDAEQKLRKLIGVVMSYPEYQLQ